MWALYNALKFWTLYNLSEDEVRLLLLTFSDNELKLTKICKTNDSKWDSVLAPAYSAFLSPEIKLRYQHADDYPSLELKNDSDTDDSFFKKM